MHEFKNVELLDLFVRRRPSLKPSGVKTGYNMRVWGTGQVEMYLVSDLYF